MFAQLHVPFLHYSGVRLPCPIYGTDIIYSSGRFLNSASLQYIVTITSVGCLVFGKNLRQQAYKNSCIILILNLFPEKDTGDR